MSNHSLRDINIDKNQLKYFEKLYIKLFTLHIRIRLAEEKKNSTIVWNIFILCKYHICTEAFNSKSINGEKQINNNNN